MKISKQARRDAKRLFGVCTVNGALDEARVRQAVQAVIQGKPRGYVGLLHHFQRLVKLDIARRTARVESVVPLGSGLKASVESNLARKYGTGLNVVFDVNPALLGGLRIQVGSDVYDGSVATRLASLDESF